MSDSNVTDMDPNASPDTLKTGVRRVNNIPIYAILGVLGAFLIIMAFVASSRYEQQQSKKTAALDSGAGSADSYARDIAGKYQGDPIVRDSTVLMVPEPLPTAEPEAEYQVYEVPLAPPVVASDEMEPLPEPTAFDAEAERIRRSKIQLAEEAIRSATRVKTDTVGFRPSAMSTDPSNSNSSMLSRIADAKRRINNLRTTDPTAAYQGRLREIQHITGNADASSTDPRQSLSYSSGGAGAPESNNDRWTLESGGIRPPGTLFEIRAGFVIPAMLISGIQSDLPGQIIAQISQNVYDTPTGRHMLLPQGSRLVGSYSADVQFGQSRVLIAWQRIIFPDGKALDLGEMPGADGAGYAGFNDQVNDHYFRMFASAVLMSVVTAGITLSQDTDTGSDNNDARSVNQVMAESLGEQLGQVTSQVIAKNLNVSPTLTIRPGYRFNVLVTRDLTFKRPYAAFHYDGQG